MIHCVLTQKELEVSQSTSILPFQFSANINIQFIKDTKYKSYAVTPFYAWVPTKSVKPRRTDVYKLGINNGVFTLPRNAFMRDGFVVIAFALSDGKQVLETEPIYLAVNASIGLVDILPPKEDVWQVIVTDYVRQYIEIYVQSQLEKVYARMTTIEKSIEATNTVVKELQNQTVLLQKSIEKTNETLSQTNAAVKALQTENDTLRKNLATTTNSYTKVINMLATIGVWQGGITGGFVNGMGIAGGNINLFGGSQDGSHYIRTSKSNKENDLAGGV